MDCAWIATISHDVPISRGLHIFYMDCADFIWSAHSIPLPPRFEQLKIIAY